jgi:lysophospholipase L1-like esterase
VDFWTPFAELQRRGEAESYYLDGMHPTPKGHELMAQIICDALKRAGLWSGQPGETE